MTTRLATLSPVQRMLDALRSRGGDEPRQHGREWLAHCPAHEDGTASLSLAEGDDGRALVLCRAGCETKDVLAALDLSPRDLFAGEAPAPARDGKPEIVATYDYRDESGTLLSQAVRFEPKDFRQRAPNGSGWTWKLGDVRRVLYRLPELVAADPAQTVFAVEGEKDADRLAALGMIATTCAMGAGKWRPEYTETLRGRHVVILPDHDDPGRAHAADVSHALFGVAASVRILELPDLPEKGDVSDWLDAGGTREALEGLAAAAAPETFAFEPEEWKHSAPGELPEIEVEPGKLSTIVDDAEAAIMRQGGVYQRGGSLVRIGRIESGTERKGITRQPGALIIGMIEASWLRERMSKAARWLRYDRRGKDWIPIDCPADVAVTYLARGGMEWRVPVLAGIIEAPTLRADGSILHETGYDERTGLFFDPGSARFPMIPTDPTRSDAERALETLADPLAKFPFVADEDRAVALSAILTALVRHAIDHAPIHAFSAPKPRSGKSLLADIVSLMATGRRGAVMPQAKTADEERKRVLPVLMEGDPVVIIDNVALPLGSDALAQVLTQPVFRDRVMGTNMKTAFAPTGGVLWLATGNNLTFWGDTSARALRCDIDPEMERPEERKFDRDLFRWIPEHRGRLVVAALTILRAYHLAGRPALDDLPRWGGFDQWSDWIRSALVWAGAADPCLTRQRIADADPVTVGLAALLTAWYGVFAEGLVTVADLRRETDPPETRDGHRGELNPEAEALRAAALEVAGDSHGKGIDARRLGKYLPRMAGRIEGGLRAEAAGTRQGVALWRVRAIG